MGEQHKPFSSPSRRSASAASSSTTTVTAATGPTTTRSESSTSTVSEQKQRHASSAEGGPPPPPPPPPPGRPSSTGGAEESAIQSSSKSKTSRTPRSKGASASKDHSEKVHAKMNLYDKERLHSETAFVPMRSLSGASKTTHCNGDDQGTGGGLSLADTGQEEQEADIFPAPASKVHTTNDAQAPSEATSSTADTQAMSESPGGKANSPVSAMDDAQGTTECTEVSAEANISHWTAAVQNTTDASTPVSTMDAQATTEATESTTNVAEGNAGDYQGIEDEQRRATRSTSPGSVNSSVASRSASDRPMEDGSPGGSRLSLANVELRKESLSAVPFREGESMDSPVGTPDESTGSGSFSEKYEPSSFGTAAAVGAGSKGAKAKAEPGRASRLFAPKSWSEKFRSTKRRLKQNILVSLGASQSSRDVSFENTQLRYKRVQDSLEKLRTGVTVYLQRLCQSCDASCSLASTLNFLASSDLTHGVVSDHPHVRAEHGSVPPQLSARSFLTMQYELKQLTYKSIEQHVTNKILQPIGALMNQLAGIKHLLEKRRRYQTDVDAYKRKVSQVESAKQRNEHEVQRQREKLSAAEDAFEKVTNAVLKCLSEMECARALLVQDTLNTLVASQVHFHSIMSDAAVTALPYFTDVSTPRVELSYITSSKAQQIKSVSVPDRSRRVEADEKLVFQPLEKLLEQLLEGRPTNAEGAPSEEFQSAVEKAPSYSQKHQDITTTTGKRASRDQKTDIPSRYFVNDSGTTGAVYPPKQGGVGLASLHDQMGTSVPTGESVKGRTSYTGIQTAIQSMKRHSTVAWDAIAAYDVERRPVSTSRNSSSLKRK
eukprot:gb/GECG01005595.1/.p1 GENE.gb/GECG01005595.1/~~gb/GECG01005595.1/.p1  ORF type:complete len:831 (+),score=129.69 gb/GECG01005595.1/:1-2493(+)